MIIIQKSWREDKHAPLECAFLLFSTIEKAEEYLTKQNAIKRSGSEYFIPKYYDTEFSITNVDEYIDSEQQLFYNSWS